MSFGLKNSGGPPTMNAMEKRRKNISRKSIDGNTKEEHLFFIFEKEASGLGRSRFGIIREYRLLRRLAIMRRSICQRTNSQRMFCLYCTPKIHVVH